MIVLSVPYSHSHEKRRDCVVCISVVCLLIPSTSTVLEFESYFQSSFKNIGRKIGRKFRDVGVSEFSLVSGGRVLGNRSWSQLFMLGRSHLGSHFRLVPVTPLPGLPCTVYGAGDSTADSRWLYTAPVESIPTDGLL